MTTTSSKKHWSPLAHRAFRCQCGRPVFFGNTQCLACGTELGYDPDSASVWPLQPADRGHADREGTGQEGSWRRWGDVHGPLYRRCANHRSAMACSWLTPEAECQKAEREKPTAPLYCRSCRLNRVLPDLSRVDNQLLWARVERDKQRLIASLIALGLPVASRELDDPAQGLAFDLLRGSTSATPVIIGHHSGVITLDIDEADDVRRETVREQMDEPYRTVLGHLRHESGHYYWSRLVERGPWLDSFRGVFGDERADYACALQRNHAQGPAPNWRQSFVSAYASAHPWEDWAETWAHYLHIVDTLDTALSFGLDTARSGLLHDRFDEAVLYRGGPHWPTPALADEAASFIAWIHAWIELAAVLNELSRSMGNADFYPFVLSASAVTKLHFVHRVVHEESSSRF